MMAYSVTIEGNRVAGIREMPAADYDELGLEWALSELKDTYRHSKNVNASFSLADGNELREFLSAVAALLGPDALDEQAQQLLQE
jgi:hypothetical protein